MKYKIKISIDILMYVLYIYLMSYCPGLGLINHGIAGCVLLIVFFVHNILNFRWYNSLGKGKYNAMRILFVTTNIPLFVLMILMAVSSVMLSGEIFVFSPFFGNRAAKQIHIISTAWGFVLMSVHLGLHTSGTFERLYKKANTRFSGIAYRTLYTIIFASGAIAFAASNLPKAMFLLHGGFAKSVSWRFYVQYILITLFCCLVANLVIKFLKKKLS